MIKVCNKLSTANPEPKTVCLVASSDLRASGPAACWAVLGALWTRLVAQRHFAKHCKPACGRADAEARPGPGLLGAVELWSFCSTLMKSGCGSGSNPAVPVVYLGGLLVDFSHITHCARACTIQQTVLNSDCKNSEELLKQPSTRPIRDVFQQACLQSLESHSSRSGMHLPAMCPQTYGRMLWILQQQPVYLAQLSLYMRDEVRGLVVSGFLHYPKGDGQGNATQPLLSAFDATVGHAQHLHLLVKLFI